MDPESRITDRDRNTSQHISTHGLEALRFVKYTQFSLLTVVVTIHSEMNSEVNRPRETRHRPEGHTTENPTFTESIRIRMNDQLLLSISKC
jgi:hypothetical protein